MQLIELDPALAQREEIVERATWSVEIHLAPGGVVRERTFASGPFQAVEAALARSFIVPGQVYGISAQPVG